MPDKTEEKKLSSLWTPAQATNLNKNRELKSAKKKRMEEKRTKDELSYLVEAGSW